MRVAAVLLSLAAGSAASAALGGVCACGSLLSVGDDDGVSPAGPVDGGALPGTDGPDPTLPDAGDAGDPGDAASPSCVAGPSRFCSGFDTSAPFDGWDSNPGGATTTAALFVSPPNAMIAQVSNSLDALMVWKWVAASKVSVRAKLVVPSATPGMSEVKLVVIKCRLLAGDIAVVKVNNLGASLKIGNGEFALGTLETARFSTVELSLGTSQIVARVAAGPVQSQPLPPFTCTSGLEVGVGVDPSGAVADIAAVVDDVDISWD